MLGRLLFRPHNDQAEERSQFPLTTLAGLTDYIVAGAPGTVSIERALTHSAISACVDVLASSVSMLPIDGVRTVGGARLPVSPTPRLLSDPSPLVELDVWLYQLVDSMATDGNAFGLITGTAGGFPSQVDLVDPANVTRRCVVEGVAQADVHGTTHKVYPFGDLLHIPGKLVRAGSPFAQSPIRRAAETIRGALAARRFGADFFDAGGKPTGFLKSDDPNLTPEGADAAKRKFLEATSGRAPAVFGSGWAYEQLQTTPGDSQFLETMRFAIEEACRFFRVPPSMVFAATSGQNITYANVSQADLHYLRHTLDPYLVRVEGKLTRLLPRPQIARFNRSALLRSDAAGRWAIHDLRLKNRSTSINEVRALEDEEPFDDPAFDQPGIPAPTVDSTDGGGGLAP